MWRQVPPDGGVPGVGGTGLERALDPLCVAGAETEDLCRAVRAARHRPCLRRRRRPPHHGGEHAGPRGSAATRPGHPGAARRSPRAPAAARRERDGDPLLARAAYVPSCRRAGGAGGSADPDGGAGDAAPRRRVQSRRLRPAPHHHGGGRHGARGREFRDAVLRDGHGGRRAESRPGAAGPASAERARGVRRPPVSRLQFPGAERQRDPRPGPGGHRCRRLFMSHQLAKATMAAIGGTGSGAGPPAIVGR